MRDLRQFSVSRPSAPKANIMSNGYVLLNNRGVIKITGSARKAFLQGLITNDATALNPSQSLYSALLTPQGRYLFDFFLFERNDAIYIETERERIAPLIQRLNLYKLRSDAKLEDVSQAYASIALVGDAVGHFLNPPLTPGSTPSLAENIIAFDPRLTELGVRALIPTNACESFIAHHQLERLPYESYESMRLSLGVPDGSRDMPVEKAIPLECGLDELNAIAWNKGCYLGQELNARTKYRGMIRKRLFPVAITGPIPNIDDIITWRNEEAGVMRTSFNDKGLALLRIEMAKEAITQESAFTCGHAQLMPIIPEWVQLP